MALPTSGLIINLDAKGLQLSADASVTTWPDQSGSNNSPVFESMTDGQPGVAPIYRTNYPTPNGSPSVHFDNGALAFPTNTIFNSSVSAEVFIVVRIFQASTDNSGLYQFGGNDWTYYTYTDNYIYDGSFTNSRFSFAAADPASWHIYNVSHDGSIRTARVDGTVKSSQAAAFVPPSQAVKSTMRIGRSQGVPWRGLVAAFVAYNRVLTSTERTQVSDYLTSRYFTTVTNDPQVAQAPAARLAVDLPITYRDPKLVIPAAGLTVEVQATTSDSTVIPAAGLSLGLPVTSSAATLTLSLPADGDTLRSGTPTFTVTLTAPDPTVLYTIEIQYADDTAFTNPTTLSDTATAADGGVYLTPSAAVPATTYWRARLLLDGDEEITWTNPRSFTVDSSVFSTNLDVTWTVDSSAERAIHVWHLDPPGPLVGDTVTIYGQGLPATGTLSYGDLYLAPTSWQRIDETADNADDYYRTINGDTVTPEHYEITFVAPASDGPGDALVVEG